jgi:hypothetical protein
MKKCISYSLFGYNKERHESCFDFNSYLRGLAICLRMNRLIYPDWEIVLNTDQKTYDAFKDLFDKYPITIRINEEAPLCYAMLWRMKPIFELENGKWKYTHVLCRDLDSPATYREAQAVKYWMNKDKAVHAITDSVSHDVALMGGMIGVIPKYFTMFVGNSFEAMMGAAGDMDFSRKGSDQNFLNHYIYPKVGQKGSDSITQHYFNGYGNTFLSDYHTCTCPPTAGHASHCVNNIEIDLPYHLADSNNVCGHIGASGWYETALFKFLRKYWHEFEDLFAIEKEYKNIFYWCAE